MIEYEMLIETENGCVIPAVLDGVTWQTERKNYPGTLSFEVVIDEALKINEGNNLSFKKGGQNVFFGYIFKKNRDKENIYKVTAYDQLRYFKNKDTYNYQDKTASQLLAMLANDFELKTGAIEETGYKIPTRLEKDKTLFDIIGNALDLTFDNTKNIFCLYDDFGKICLKDIKNMTVPILVDSETGENFDYASSIDESTYNKIKIIFKNEKTGKDEVYVANDNQSIDKWGVLQYFETVEKGENGKGKADKLLSLYNKKSQSLMVKNTFGDIRVRAGSTIIVQLDFGDLKLNNLMLVEKAKHTFKEGEHYMDLNLKGYDIFA